MIIVSGWLSVDPQERAGYLAGCEDVMAQARKAPGCLDFALSADPIEPGRILVYERWESDADVERFRGAGPDSGQAALIRDAQVARYRISAVEAP
ncbi:antibiotic biosynthesis monooxygenase [Actinomadura craniellae]|uniref:Antibiotic biosynthesis monooxygenase n=1 Tax=Actinomadura craniellae TaxID=2231787 RepID=A0A365H3S9_9ACTN|nr:antibiotic biosynthesis monooxygenase family protein [Actinomadura craniellae]RAY13757.1 antibiotic biosynthesis monooxygenase [Actinomadura craniellae]